MIFPNQQYHTNMKLKTIDHFCGDLIPNMMVDGLRGLNSSQLRILKDTNSAFEVSVKVVCKYIFSLMSVAHPTCGIG